MIQCALVALLQKLLVNLVKQVITYTDHRSLVYNNTYLK